METIVRRTRLALLVVAGAIGSVASAQTISSVGLWAWSGPPQLGLGYPGVSSRADAINADGTAVAATLYLSAGQQSPLSGRWDPSVGLSTTSCGWVGTLSMAISGDGQQLAGTTTFGTSNYTAARWASPTGCSIGLGTLPGQPAGQIPTALGMSASGNLVVGHGHTAGAPFGTTIMPKPFFWTPGGGMVEPAYPAGRSQGVLRAASANGAVMVGESGWQDGIVYGYHREAAYWDSTGVHQMGWMAAGIDSVATACSNDGSTIVGAADIQSQGIFIPSPGPLHAFRWQGSYQDLGLMPNAPANGWSYAQAVTHEGSTVFGRGLEGASDVEAFMWRADMAMIRLEDMLGWLGVNLAGWDLNEVTGVSADARAICGNGTIGGSSVGFVVRDLPPLCGPLITLQPSNTIVCAGDTAAIFTTGYFPAHTTMQWYQLFDAGGGLYFQIPVTNGPRPSGALVTGANSDLLEFINATPSEAGLYACVISGGCATVQTQIVTLTVRTLPSFVIPPPLTTNAVIHGSFTLGVSVTSSWGETPTYQWKKNNVPLVDGSSCGSTIAGSQTPTLTVTNVAGVDEGTYGIDVTGYCGTIGAGAQVLVCITDLDDGSNTGTPDGFTDISDLFYFLNEFSFGNPSVDVDDGSSTGAPDCSTDLGDLLYYLTRFNNGC